MGLRRYWTGICLAALAAFVLHATWIGPWWRSVRPRPGKQVIPIKAEWFHARSLERDGDKWGMDRVGYTDIDYEYVAPNSFEAGSDEVGFKRTVINELGGRGVLPAPIRDGPERLVIIGDSFAFGRGLDEHETLAVQMRRVHIQKRGEELHVYNLAVGGYSFWATMEVLAHKAVYLNPDRILYVTYNRDNYADGLTHARKICEGLDIRFDVAFHPAWNKGAKEVRSTAVHVKRICTQAGVPFHDFSRAMEGRPNKELVATDGHPSVVANMLAARAFVDAWGGPTDVVSRRAARARLLGASFPYIEKRLEALRGRLRDDSEIEWVDQRLRIYRLLDEICERDRQP